MEQRRIAYFINQYPKVSHSFIRREIHALERQGFAVLRIALRGWNDALADAEDLQERKLTRYVLQAGLPALLPATLRAFSGSPRRFFAALRLALRMGWRAERPLPYHLIYLAEACAILPWLKQFGARHVHAHFGTNSAEIVMLAQALGGPAYSFTVHGPEEFDKPVFLGLGEKIRRAAFVVAISSYGRSQLFRWIEHPEWAKVKVVHCGLERGFYQDAHTPPAANARLVCVGRLCEQKGQLLLLEALHGLKQKGIAFELVLAGDGEMRAEIERLIAAYDLGSSVRITGWISSAQVRAEILRACVMVLPSFAEGLPVVLMEAMALRRPVLSTQVAGIAELVQPGVNGWLVPAGSVSQLMAALEHMLTLSSAQLATMGDAGYRRVTARHAIDIEAGKLAALFQETVTC